MSSGGSIDVDDEVSILVAVSHHSSPVIVIGAGLAGLRCAQVLQRNGREVVVLEANGEPGGRVRSHIVDGFVIDEGFQLLNPSYPEIVASGVLNHLDIRRFPAALDFFHGEARTRLGDPRRYPTALAGALGYVGVGQFLRLSARLLRSTIRPATSLQHAPDCTTLEGLQHAGFSTATIDNVVRPFLRGTVLDDSLDTSWHYTQLLFKSFGRGRPATMPGGIAELPRALAKDLDIRYNTRAIHVTPHRVTTPDLEFAASHVVVATDASTTHDLVGTSLPQWRRQFTWWWNLPSIPRSGVLRIDLDEPLLASALNLSSVAPERSPAGRALIATPSLVGSYTDTERARASVARMYGVPTSEVELVTTSDVDHALPVCAPSREPVAARHSGLLLAGDYCTTPSIQGAMVSGRRAATAILDA